MPSQKPPRKKVCDRILKQALHGNAAMPGLTFASNTNNTFKPAFSFVHSSTNTEQANAENHCVTGCQIGVWKTCTIDHPLLVSFGVETTSLHSKLQIWKPPIPGETAHFRIKSNKSPRKTTKEHIVRGSRSFSPGQSCTWTPFSVMRLWGATGLTPGAVKWRD